MKVIIYTAGLFGKSGLSTWVRNFVMAMHKDYDITLLSNTFGEAIHAEMRKYVDCTVYNGQTEYECDILLHNYQDNAVKPNIHARHTFILLHCDYARMGHSRALQTDNKYIAVSDEAADVMRRVYKIDCRSIQPFLTEHKPKKVLRLVSATRIHKTKGWNRMLDLCKALKAKDIRFQWLIFSDEKKTTEYPEMVFMGETPNDVVLDYVADADYLVQLSDHEGWCYSVHEALSVGTPCLVTDIPIFRNAIENGRNGYRLPLDMKDINIDEIITNIPLGYAFNDESLEAIKQKWSEVLNG